MKQEYLLPLSLIQSFVLFALYLTVISIHHIICRIAACSGGMIGVSAGEVRVMATTFEWAEEIDLARAERAQQAAKEKLDAMERHDQEFAVTEAKLKRALARIHAKG